MNKTTSTDIFIFFLKNSKQILVILMLQTPMQGYYVLVCSASWALGRPGKHKCNPLVTTESAALSSSRWIIYPIVDKPKKKGRRPRLTYQSLITRVRRQPSAGTWNTEEQFFVRLTGQSAGVLLNGLVRYAHIPQHVHPTTLTYWASTNCVLSHSPGKLQKTQTWTDDDYESNIVFKICCF